MESIRTVEYQGRSIQWDGRQLRVVSGAGYYRNVKKWSGSWPRRVSGSRNCIVRCTWVRMSAFLAHGLNQPAAVMELTLSDPCGIVRTSDSGRAMRKIIQNNLRQIQRATETIQKFRRFF
jgi:hypothetical protein